MIFFDNLIKVYKHSAIRHKIMFFVLINSVVTVGAILFISTLFSRIMNGLEDSFQTNTVLDDYLYKLEETKLSLESYIKSRSFESLDKFYIAQSETQEATYVFHENPSTIKVLQNEFIIRKLSFSFFNLAQKAVDFRLANNVSEADVYFNKSLDCYSHLRSKIIELDMLCFSMNAKSYKYNKTRITLIIKRIIIAMLALIVLAIVFPYLCVFRITRPLSQISKVAMQVAERDFDVPLFNRTDDDEIGNICRAFDAMIISIREYVDAIWERAIKENELREREIELRSLYTEAHLKVLQNQIKPHFLFNTLNTGAQLAMIEGADKTCYFLEQVSGFLRYSLQHLGNEATIGEELGMVDNYIYIMKVRFDDKYTFVKHVDDSLLSAKMPDIILQPLLENCIKHGLKDIAENGLIEISVRGDESCIEIKISDNGIGFDPEIKKRIFMEVESGGNGVKLGDLNEKMDVNRSNLSDEESDSHVSMGLVNVISRLRMYFKSDDVFTILDNTERADFKNDSKLEGHGKGTVFVIKMKR